MDSHILCIDHFDHVVLPAHINIMSTRIDDRLRLVVEDGVGHEFLDVLRPDRLGLFDDEPLDDLKELGVVDEEEVLVGYVGHLILELLDKAAGYLGYRFLGFRALSFYLHIVGCFPIINRK